MSISKLHCIGHITLDAFLMIKDADLHCDINHTNCKVCFDFGAKIPVDSTYYGMGGGAANVAVGVKKLGFDTYIHSIIGNDPKGKDIAKLLQNYEVDTSYLKTDEHPTDQSAIISYSGERTIFTYAYPRQFRLKMEAADYIYLSSVGDNVCDLYEDVIFLKQKKPSPMLFYNPGSRELKSSRGDILNLLEFVDYLIVNIEEGCKILDPSLKRGEIEISDLLDLLVQKGAKNVVLTDGADNVYAFIENKLIKEPTRPVEVVEKTGAGDAFSSGFISGVINGTSGLISVKRGILNSSAVIKQIGAQSGLLMENEMENLLRDF